MNSWGGPYYFSSSMCFELSLMILVCVSLCASAFTVQMCVCMCMHACVLVHTVCMRVHAIIKRMGAHVWACAVLYIECLVDPCVSRLKIPSAFLQGDQGDQGPRVCGLCWLLVLSRLAGECNLVLLHVSLSRIVGKRFEMHEIPGILFFPLRPNTTSISRLHF